jgi:thymidylate kinase
MSFPKIIVLTGIDGSGKTTIANRLLKYLRHKGKKTCYVWIKSLHSLAYIISVVFERTYLSKTLINPNGITIKRFDPTALKPLHKLWPYIEFISVIPWIIFKVYLPIFFGFVVIADRYVIDTVATISIRIKEINFFQTFLGRLLLKMIPKGAMLVMLDIEASSVSKRRFDVEYTCNEIKSQTALYRKLSKMLGALVIDVEKLDADDVQSLLINRLQLT